MVSAPRRGVANPYQLSTWSRTDAEAQSAEQDQCADTAAASQTGPGHARTQMGPASHSTGDAVQADDDASQDPPDPPELPRADDPFELARRTVNRSRAAARDRGLFPISAKTQQRAHDLRDRSLSAPGFSGARPDPRDPQSIAGVMRRVLGDLGWTEGMNAGRVLEEWDEIVGPSVAEHCRPVSLDAGVLVVSASSSAWAAQLRMLTPQLISRIEEHVGAHVISELTVTGPAAAQRSWKKGRRTVTWRGVRDTYG